ncbi:perilipin-1 isoform X1 [Puntigrus tetrazona]|uniref:perilipin-1 isoform X1 n=1 Tax=Puntigrus tetrazona TaxID=1606681 RepID=UPI001C89FC6E|nr:perilipin-1 isoform X1 [Puntigrus tetrazona]
MASEKKDTVDVLKEQNVLLRIRNLRSVSSALESIGKTYIHTKQSHPIITSVCEMYEKGVSTAGSLAVWSIQPALHVLEPQLVAANSLACRGLDHLEEKVPALQYPPEELTASIKELVSSTLETAKDSVSCPIRQTSNVVLDKVSTWYQQSKNALSDGICYVFNSKLVCLAEQRADRALSLMENLVDFVLPASSTETEDDGSMGEQDPDVGTSGPKPSFSRLGALAGTICRRAFEKTAAQLQRSKRQGQALVTQIPGVSPLSNGLPRLVSGLGQQLLKIYESVVANVKKPHQTSFNLAKDGVSLVLRSFGIVRERALHNLSYYGLIPRRSSKPEGGSQKAENDRSKECLSCTLVLETTVGDHMHSPSGSPQKQPLKVTELKEISEETRQLKKKVMKQIPIQQKVVLGGSNKKVSNHRSQRKSLTDCTQIYSSSSSYIRTVQNSRNASPTAE